MAQRENQPIDFAARRRQFLNRIKGGVAVFPSALSIPRNSDVHFPFRQESLFFYLTGFAEPQSILLFHEQAKKPFQMFVQPRDKTKELWEGKIHGPESAMESYGADLAFPSAPPIHFDEAFVEAMLGASTLYYRVGVNPEWDQRIFRLLAIALRKIGRTGRPLWPIVDPTDILGEMRLFKTKAEIDRLQIAGQISAEAHINAMRITKPGMYEYEVEGVLYHAFRAHGAAREGYGSIVASGANACVLHYTENSRRMQDKDLLLIDAGAEFDYYTADITRVFPVGGSFTQEQREVYGAVLTAQKECIKLAKPGGTLAAIHAHAVEVLVEELRRLKILKGSSARLIKNNEYRPYYPHHTSHWLGMDVHDVGRYYNGQYSNHRKLQPGMVFTIEPGLYFAPTSEAPARFKGIGVRIEDDLLVTSGGVKVLTSGVPKEIDEVESICSQP